MPHPRSRRTVPGRRRAVAVLAAAVAAVVVLAGCSSDPLADQYRAGSGKNYVAGDGTVTEFPPSGRGAPVEFSGPTEDGGTFSSSDHLGQVLVVNFWYASCAPCRAEAPTLEKVSADVAGDGATFVGVNVRDQPATAAAFEKTYGVSYPSIIDTDGGGVQLAFAGAVPANAVPTTIVLDKTGRVAARILGQLQAASILETLVRDTIAETE